MARLAVENYLLNAAEIVKAGDGYAETSEIERAMQIALEVRMDPDGLSQIEKRLRNLLDETVSLGRFSNAIEMLRIMQKHKFISSSTEMASIAEKMAVQCEEKKDFESASQAIDVVCKIWRTARNAALAQAARIKAAQLEERAYLHFKDREESALLLAYRAGRVLEAYRRAGHQKEKAEEFQRLLKQHQRDSLGEMKSLTSTVEVSEIMRAGEDLVKGQDTIDAMIKFGTVRLISKSSVRAQVEASLKQCPVTHLFSKTMIDSSGNVVARPPSAISFDPEQAQKGLLSEMFSRCAFSQVFYGGTYLDSARRTIVSQHASLDLILRQLVTNNPFIPEGREDIYFRGLTAGFMGDWLVCTFLLVFQLENSLRNIFSAHGIRTTSTDDAGIQKELDLNTMLTGEFAANAESILGEDIIFELRSLLIERTGHNLRNKIAHGLTDSEIPDELGNYFLWLVLRLCVAYWYFSTFPTDAGRTAGI
jgi:hypothetical protein